MENEMKTAHDINKWGAMSTRIYPLVPIEDTPLIDLIDKGLYCPLSLKEAIERVKPLFLFFEKHNIRILRMGLHPSENLNASSEPFHPAFGQLVKSAVWEDVFDEVLLENTKNQSIQIFLSPKEKVYAIGYKKGNLEKLQRIFNAVSFIADSSFSGREYHADIN